MHPRALGDGKECRRLLQSEALARPPALPLGGADERSDVRPTKSRASACRIARVSALCPMATAALEYRSAIVVSA